MVKTNKVGQIAIAKLRYSPGLQEFCASLTPAESLYLLEIGCVLPKHSQYEKDWWLGKMSKGISSANWCYFIRVPTDIAAVVAENENRRQKKALKANRL